MISKVDQWLRGWIVAATIFARHKYTAVSTPGVLANRRYSEIDLFNLKLEHKTLAFLSLLLLRAVHNLCNGNGYKDST